MTTIATLFSGGEGVGIGARQAGLTHLWGIEYSDDIANVARMNGFYSITADVMSVDPHTLPIPDVLHASPVCKRASGANQSAELNEDGTKEAPEDIEAGKKIAQFIDAMTPNIFTLENVFAYRNFKAFKIICAALNRNGYMWDFDNLNSADFGVPQTRRRLILRAKRGALLPNLPQPARWIGWYEAIEDLIPGLPESQFAEWQLKRLPQGLFESSLIERHGAFNLQEENRIAIAGKDEPIWTVRASQRALEMATGFIIDGDGNRSRPPTILSSNEPSMTIQSWHGRRPIQMPRAWLLDDQRTTDGSPTQRDSSEPSFPILAGYNHPIRAYLVSSIDSTIREQAEPANTLVCTGDGHSIPPRAWLSQGRVVKMTTRALARFQSIPDSYKLSGNNKLDCTVIGNAVPPKLYRSIIEGLTQ